MEEKLTDVVRQVVVEAPFSAISGVTFDEIAERAWKKLISRALVEAIDAGTVRHIANRYYAS